MRTAPEGRDSRLRPSKRVCEVRINRIDSNVFFVAVSARRTRCPKVELRRESLVTNPSLRFQESTMAVAIRTGDKTAQTAGVCGRDLEIELKPRIRGFGNSLDTPRPERYCFRSHIVELVYSP